MDDNDWSHPRFVKLAQTATGGVAWVHSSQIASLRKGQLKSPGPRSFAALVYLFNAIDEFQRGVKTKDSPDWTGQEEFIKDKKVIRDDEGRVASIGWHFEVFVAGGCHLLKAQNVISPMNKLLKSAQTPQNMSDAA